MEHLRTEAALPKEDPIKRHRTVVMLAVLDENEPIGTAWRTATTGYLLPDNDPGRLLSALIGIHNGTAINGMAGKKVSVRLHEEGHEREKVALSPREKDVLHALVEGMSYKMIAHSLGISFETVRSHIKRIYEKLQVHNNTEAVARTIREGLLA